MAKIGVRGQREVARWVREEDRSKIVVTAPVSPTTPGGDLRRARVLVGFGGRYTRFPEAERVVRVAQDLADLTIWAHRRGYRRTSTRR